MPTNTSNRETVELTLPFPPSTNALFRNVPGKGRVRSAVYKAWAIEAGYVVNRARPIKGPVAVSVRLAPPNKRKRDADNSLKPILDLLVKHGIIEADDWSVVRKVEAEWIEAGSVPPCVVTSRGA